MLVEVQLARSIVVRARPRLSLVADLHVTVLNENGPVEALVLARIQITALSGIDVATWLPSLTAFTTKF